LSEASSTESVNRKVLGSATGTSSVEILLVQEAEDCIVEKSELVEMWESKASDFPRWLWHAIDAARAVLIYVFGAKRRSIPPACITRTVWHQTIL